MPTEVSPEIRQSVNGVVDGIVANAKAIRAGSKPLRYATIAYLRAIVLGTLMPDEKNLDVPMLGRFGQAVISRAVSVKYGKASKDGTKISRVPIESFTLDMVLGLTRENWDDAVLHLQTAKLKDLALVRDRKRTVYKLDDEGRPTEREYSEESVLTEYNDAVKALNESIATAQAWYTQIGFQTLGHVVLALNELTGGKLKIGSLPELPVALIVPIMIAGYILNATTISRFYGKSIAKSEYVMGLRAQRLAAGQTAGNFVRQQMTLEQVAATVAPEVPAEEPVTV